VAISQASGHTYDLPWDSVYHYARGGKQTTMHVSVALKRLRKERGLTQQALARAAGLSRVHLARLEAGTSFPTLETVLALARALRVPPSEFVS
jgi:DNA-binding XRE family transcriptional regulator